MVPDTRSLRQQIRRQRRQLDRFRLQQAEAAVCHRVLALADIRHAQHIGIYLDDFGEIPTKQIIKQLCQRGKKIYLPLICEMNQQLRWHSITWQHYSSRRFYRHRLGMQQAMQQRALSYKKLDCVLMPLVLFDRLGHRVGMGGGFYDRTLRSAPKVLRIGLAHDFQLSAQLLTQQAWDQSLDQVCTPSHNYRFKR